MNELLGAQTMSCGGKIGQTVHYMAFAIILAFVDMLAVIMNTTVDVIRKQCSSICLCGDSHEL
jgi:hypothetical protein